MNKNTKRNTKIQNTKTATTKTTTKKEENIMKKNTEIVGGASVTLTKKGCGTITFVQPNKGDLVSYTVFGVTTKVTKEEAEKAIEDFKSDKWKVSEIVKHDEKVDYSAEYQQRVASINNPSKNKKSDGKKPTTYGEAITQKYGTEEHRKAVGAMTKVVASEWREQYLKTGKVVCKRSEYRQKLWAEAEKRVAEAEKA